MRNRVYNMTENNKKRGNSFRKIFPNIFFSNKNKDKPSLKDTSGFKSKASKSNQYQNPKFVIDKYESTVQTEQNDERIYENLTTAFIDRDANDANSNDLISNNSSSSTLVSENVRNTSQSHNAISSSEKHVKYMARPQVPPKPNQEILYASPVPEKHQKNYARTPYPDVYYHSVEKLTDKISVLDEIEIYRASQVQAHPASVGAEIKKVSTKFLISPKKEAEVRTIQPIRARSLSLDKNNSKDIENSRRTKTEKIIEKPYNYSAPTSPIAVGHKIPNMPTTVSPYERVKQNMIEAEEKRNSLSRSSYRNKSLPSPRSFYQDLSKSPTLSNNFTKEDLIKKEKTRQRVEAFYWQKIKELKQKEDEYLLRQSLGNSSRGSRTQYASYSNSSCSTPTSFTADSRSCSLPRGRDLNFASQTMNISPFSRGAPERRTDSYIKRPGYQTDHDLVQYRNPENVYSNVLSRNHLPIFQRGSLTTAASSVVQQPKRVSFEGNNIPKNPVQQDVRTLNVQCKNNKCKIDHRSELNAMKLGPKDQKTHPPLPPIRTTSVLGGVKSNRLPINKNVVTIASGTRSVCSESESGSEAGEIQRIMHSNSRKGK